MLTRSFLSLSHISSLFGLLLALGIAPPLHAKGTPQEEEGRRAYIISLEEPIGYATAMRIADGIEQADREDASCIILMINTPGGDVSVTDYIVTHILYAKQERPVYTFVRDSAISAGAPIAAAGTRMYMSEYGVIGACTVIQTHILATKVMPLKFQALMKGIMRKVGQSLENKQGGLEGVLMSMVIGTSDDPEPVVLTSKEAVQAGLCDGVVRDVEDIAKLNGFSLEGAVIHHWPFLLDSFYTYSEYFFPLGMVVLVIVLFHFSGSLFGRV